MPANYHVWSALAQDTQGAAYQLPFTSSLTIVLQIIPSGSASVAIQCSLDGSTWTAITGLTAITAATIYSLSGPYRYLRPAVTVGGPATIHMTWGDNK